MHYFLALSLSLRLCSQHSHSSFQYFHQSDLGDRVKLVRFVVIFCSTHSFAKGLSSRLRDCKIVPSRTQFQECASSAAVTHDAIGRATFCARKISRHRFVFVCLLSYARPPSLAPGQQCCLSVERAMRLVLNVAGTRHFSASPKSCF